MERNLQKNGLVNFLILLAAAGAALAVARYAHLLAGHVAAAFLGLGVLAAAVSWFQMRLEEQERLEQLELEELSRTSGDGALFQGAAADAAPARRSREQFEKFFVPGFTLGLLGLQLGGAWWLWQWLATAPAGGLNQPLVAMALLGIFALVLFLTGKYTAGLARLERQRLLRPGANHLLLGAYLFALVTGGIVAYEAGFPGVDLYLARGLVVLLGLLGMETLLSLVLEIYRPRVKGRAGRVLYESRLVGLLGQPEGLFTTAAHALDYQFGFKVSDTWFYRFLEKALAWLLVAQLGILLLSSCFVFIQPGEQGLLERFGRPVPGRELLPPGAHLKLPWPIDQVYRYTNEAVQTFVVGLPHEEAEHGDHGAAGAAETLLWTVSHAQEEFRLLVASREPAAATTAEGEAGKKQPPVNLLAANLPVQFQITDLLAWAYNHRNAGELLEQIGTREVVRYLVSVDYGEVLSRGRFQAAEDLRQRIQSAADALNLGVKILFVGFADCHPPVQVAQSFEEVVGARQKRQANLLAAEAHRLRTNALAGAEALRRKRAAEADRQRIEATALARAARFTNQLPAYQAAPSVYAMRSYLQTLARGGAGARKYVLTSTNLQDVIWLNLEERISDSILNVPLPAIPNK